jgi:RimJ/RimL family protein N-acetyltransferase
MSGPPVPVLTTDRLRLRGWRETDLAPMARMNADPEVMAHLGAPLGRRQSDMMVGRFLQKWQEEPRFGWWVVEDRVSGAFAGFAGLGEPDFEMPMGRCVEIGWRLARHVWGRGFATEAGRACLAHGFGSVALDEIVAFTVPGNARSRAVMSRLGLAEVAGGAFDHPMVPEGSPLRRHLLFRITRSAWEAAA